MNLIPCNIEGDTKVLIVEALDFKPRTSPARALKTINSMQPRALVSGTPIA
jgi:hypothetical protein